MSRVGALLAATVLAAGFPSAAQGQLPPRHGRYHIAVGVGQGKLSTSCDVCVAEKESGASFVARFGWSLHDRLAVVFDGLVYERQRNDGRGEPANTGYQVASVTAVFYANARSGVFAKLGAGVGHMTTRANTTLGGADISVTAPVIRLGLGVDLPFGRRWYATPFVDWVIGGTAGAGLANARAKTSATIFGATITWP